MADLLANLNEAQFAAVTLPSEHALILAGAGSGKTRVLTTRIAWLISTGRASPQSILAVTFTNKAAREMTTRLGAMLPINIRGMWIGTFHGLCNRMLRAHHRDAGLPQTFQILDSQDQLSAVKRMLKAAQADEDRFPPRQVQFYCNQRKEEGLRASAVDPQDEHERRMVALYAAYDEQCQREGVVDFAELLLRSYELLRANELLREHYQRRFRHILVDEFQDTNVLQYRWLKLLAGQDSPARLATADAYPARFMPPSSPPPPAAVFAVGDDDQSIYAFRGANVANMASFEREFRVGHLIKLEQNYRSHGNILDAANALIQHNEHRLGKNLWTESSAGEPIRIYEAMSDGQEAHWVLEEVRSLAQTGHLRNDIAVLYRSNAQSRVIEHALFSAGVPYRVYGGLRFFERAEIKHALAYLRLVASIDDDGAFMRVVNFPARGIGARSLELLQDAARRNNLSLAAAVETLTGAAATKLAAFVSLISGLKAQTAALPLPEMVEHLIEHSGLIRFYQTEREGQERIDNLNELVNAAAAFMAEEGIERSMPANLGVSAAAPAAQGTGLFDGEAPVQVDDDAAGATLAQTSPVLAFLSHASLEAGENQAAEGTDAVQLMTVHSAKGLEFDAVFITGLEEGLFPHENSVTATAGLEEERRLMYVAITRARERLYLSFSQTRMLHGQTRYHVASRFVGELPEQALKWLTPKGRGMGASWSDGAAIREGYGGAWESAGWQRSSGRSHDSSSRGARQDYGDTGRANSADQRAAQRFDRGIAFRIGQNVAHARFGDGVVVGIEGQGDEARVQVNFGGQGTKWLALSVAKLQAKG